MSLDFLFSLAYYPYNLYIAIYLLVHVLSYVIFISWNSAPILKSDPKLNAKYSAFARNDYHKWSIITMFPSKIVTKNDNFPSLHYFLAQIFPSLPSYHHLSNICLVRMLGLKENRLMMFGHRAGDPLSPIRRFLTKTPG